MTEHGDIVDRLNKGLSIATGLPDRIKIEIDGKVPRRNEWFTIYGLTLGDLRQAASEITSLRGEVEGLREALGPLKEASERVFDGLVERIAIAHLKPPSPCSTASLIYTTHSSSPAKPFKRSNPIMTNPESMVERVARAIFDAEFDRQSLAWRDHKWAWLGGGYLALARAALEALKTPTLAMLVAAVPEVLVHIDGSAQNAEDAAGAAFTAMISAALSEPIERAAGASG